jgi:hypothetical protein
VVDADDRRLGNCRMLFEALLDLDRVDVLAAARRIRSRARAFT